MVRKYNKFLDYIADKFYDPIFSACKAYIIYFRKDFILEPRDLYKIQDIEIENLDFKFVYIEDLGSDNIAFDIIVAPEVSFSSYDPKYKDWEAEGMHISWLTIKCSAKIGQKNLIDFKVLPNSIEVYSKEKPHKPLDGDLVPIICRNEYDDYAIDFLRTYQLKDAFKEEKLDIDILIKNMGVSLIYRNISSDYSIFGQSYFEDTEATFYDHSTNKYYKEKVKANTIVIDKLAHATFSLGSFPLTIVHECLHFHLHRKAFNFARIYTSNLSCITCSTNGIIINASNADRSKWMEIEANGIAPHILMPTNMILSLYHHYFEQEIHMGNTSFIAYVQSIISNIANRLNISIYSVKKRLMEVGVSEVKGCFDYVDDHYITPYLYKENFLKPNETFTISTKDLVSVMFNDTNLLKMLYSGKYRFVENHLIINDSKYLFLNESGEYELKEEARFHLDECAVVFKVETDGNVLKDEKSSLVSFCYLCRSLFDNLTFKLKVLKEPQLLLDKDAKNESDEEIKRLKKLLGSCLTIGEIIDVMLKENNKSKNWLCMVTGIDANTIRSYYNEDVRPDIRKAMAISIAFHLPPELSHYVTEKSQNYPKTTEGDYLIYVMCTQFDLTVEKVNNYLVNSLSLKPLTNKFE